MVKNILDRIRRWFTVPGLRPALASIFLALTMPSGAYAQSLNVDRWTPPLPTQTERKLAEVVSWGTALTSIGLDIHHTYASCKDQSAEFCYRAFVKQGARLGVVLVGTMVMKQVVGRTRPCVGLPEGCGIDSPNSSFPSAHTGFSFSAIGGASASWTVPLALGTLAGRVAAGKHNLSDVVAGAGFGWLASRIR
jgi:membrane-associated phospholipid phosphatase